MRLLGLEGIGTVRISFAMTRASPAALEVRSCFYIFMYHGARVGFERLLCFGSQCVTTVKKVSTSSVAMSQFC